jgi:hypothetical protein
VSWLRENAEIEFANANFVSTSINLKNKSAGDVCPDKTIEKIILRAIRASTFSRSQRQKRTWALPILMSTYQLPISDVPLVSRVSAANPDANLLDGEIAFCDRAGQSYLIAGAELAVVLGMLAWLTALTEAGVTIEPFTLALAIPSTVFCRGDSIC